MKMKSKGQRRYAYVIEERAGLRLVRGPCHWESVIDQRGRCVMPGGDPASTKKIRWFRAAYARTVFDVYASARER
jgi:hypothetical protein